jgi:hypothetical protein
VGVWRITTGLNIKMSKPRTMNVYGRLRAILTIHMNLHTPRRTTVVAFNQKKIGRAGRSRPTDVRKAQERPSTLCGAQSNSTRLNHKRAAPRLLLLIQTVVLCLRAVDEIDRSFKRAPNVSSGTPKILELLPVVFFRCEYCLRNTT